MCIRDSFCATRLTVQPGASVCVADPAAYGCILIEGYGRLGAFASVSYTHLKPHT